MAILDLAIQFTAPVAGDEWSRGTTRTVTWTNDTAKQADATVVTLYLGNRDWANQGVLKLRSIAQTTAGAGSYSWAIADDEWATPDWAFVRLYFVDAALDVAGNVVGESKNFRILTAPFIDDIVPNATIYVKQGKSTTVTWTANGYTGSDNVSIEARQDGGDWVSIATGVNCNGGTYTWNVANTWPPGIWEIGIKDLNGLYFISHPIQITDINATITITAPIAGNSWKRGTVAIPVVNTITWDDFGISTEEVKLEYKEDQNSWPGTEIHRMYNGGGNISGTFTNGEVITQTGSGATGVLLAVITETQAAMYLTVTAGTFNNTGVLTGTDSLKTMTPTKRYVDATDDAFKWPIPLQTLGGYHIRLTLDPGGSDEELFVSDVFTITASVTALADITHKTLLVAVGSDGTNGVFYYEDISVSPHTMNSLALDQPIGGAAVSPVLSAAGYVALIPAFQRVYVCDGQKDGFYFYDPTFVRIKSTEDKSFIAGESVSQAGSVATGVYDVRVKVGSAYYYYFYQTSAANFNTTGDITGDTSAVVVTSASISNSDPPPHWNKWNVAKGSLPNSANIGDLFKGRVTLSGDKDNPHQWYQARQGDPFDFLYAKEDAQAPVAGHDAVAGRVGDILTSVIPYRDDYLIYGCAHEMWILRGDAAAGGSLDMLTNEDGTFGPKAYFFDANGNLYIVGMGGVYVIDPINKIARNITGGDAGRPARIPNFMKNISRDTYRVTCAYDIRRRGADIFMTKLSDGTGEHWWFDITTGGFFPETYAAGVSPVSVIHYDAEAAAYETILVGCSDGYIRNYDEAKYSDEGTHGTEIAIDSKVVFAPRKLGDAGQQGRVNRMSVTTGGTNSITLERATVSVYAGMSAKEVFDEADSATDIPFYQTRLDGAKRHQDIRTRIRGAYITIKVSNDQVGEGFALEEITAEVVNAGRIK